MSLWAQTLLSVSFAYLGRQHMTLALMRVASTWKLRPAGPPFSLRLTHSAFVPMESPGVAANQFGANPLPADSTTGANMASPGGAGDACSAPTLVSRGWMGPAATAVAALFLQATRRQADSPLGTNGADDLGDLTFSSSNGATAATTGLQEFADARWSVGVEVRSVEHFQKPARVNGVQDGSAAISAPGSRGAHLALCPRCARAVRQVGYFAPVFPDGQGDRGNYCVPVHRTTQILTQSKN